MGKILGLLMILLGNVAFADTGSHSKETSPMVFVAIGALLMITAVFVLNSRQKRKFNQ